MVDLQGEVKQISLYGRVQNITVNGMIERIGNMPFIDIGKGFRFVANGTYQVDTEIDGAWISSVDFTIGFVRIWRGNAGTSGSTIIDVNKNGTSMYTTQANRPTIQWNDADRFVDCVLPDITSVSNGDVITIDIDQIESGDPENVILIVESE